MARLRAAAGVCELLAVEFRKVSREYAWGETRERPFRSVTLGGGKESFRPELVQELERFRPEVVLVPGWSTGEALTVLRWCLRKKVPAVVMSESTAWDAPRNQGVEKIKGRIVRLYSSALVGGKAHREYLVQLGFPAERIETGYDAVDNSYFAKETDRIRSQGQPQSPYFLASARFLKRKNLDGLLRAYAEYVQTTQRGPWRLVILGDGEERVRLEALAGELQLRWRAEGGDRRWEMEDKNGAAVVFAGFRQYGELPAFYAGEGAFVHPAHEEPWGLVVNEAMASGLPVLVSRRCGCAGDLVAEGKNGFLLDPSDPAGMAARMREMAELPEQERKKMGEKSREIVTRYGPEQFARGMERAARTAAASPVKAGILDRMVLEALARR